MTLSQRRVGWVLLALALGWFLSLPLVDILAFPERISVLPNLETDAAAYDAFAREFARTGHIASLPSKHPPGWMIVLAALYATLGHSLVVGKLVSWCALIVTVAASAAIATRVFGRTAGAIAALLCASSPGFRGYVGTLQYEVLTAALLAVFLWLAIRTTEARHTREGFRRSISAGLVAGALVLTRETFVLVVPIAAFWMWRRSHFLQPRQALHAAILTVAVAATPAIAWSAAQTAHYGRLILISEKGPKEFELGNNALANGTYNEPLVGMSEPAGVPFILEHPFHTVRLAGRKVLYMFGILRDGWNVPHPAALWLWRATTGAVPLNAIEPVVAGGWLLALCIAALIQLHHRERMRWWLLPASAGAILLVHVITIGSYRFAIPLLPVFYILASGPLALIARRSSEALRTPAVAIATTVLMVILVGAQFQTWPLAVTYAATELEGLQAVDALDTVTGAPARVSDAQRGPRPVALLPHAYLPAGAVRVRARLRMTGEPTTRDAPVARVLLAELNGNAPCVMDVFAAQLEPNRFSDVMNRCEIQRDGPASLAVFNLGVADLAIDSIDLTWTGRQR